MLRALWSFSPSFARSRPRYSVSLCWRCRRWPSRPCSGTNSSTPLLPTDFAGWSLSAPVQESAAPEAADAANAAVLKEYGFQQFASAHYANGDNKLNIRAIRFQDASGAYGAFTFFRRPGSIREQIGRSAAWDGSHVLFWNGATLVDATLDHVTPMTASELRELAKDLPQPPGSANVAPPLPGYLPRQDLAVGLTHYSLGPEAYARSGGVLPASLVDFGSSSAEAVTANYSNRDGERAANAPDLSHAATGSGAPARYRCLPQGRQQPGRLAAGACGEYVRLAAHSPQRANRRYRQRVALRRPPRTNSSTRSTTRPTLSGTTRLVISARAPKLRVSSWASSP